MRYKVTMKLWTSLEHILVFDSMDCLAVSQDDYDRINVGDTIEVLISVIQSEPIAA